jgi:hypothetical protein
LRGLSFQDIAEMRAADRLRQDRWLELGLFVAWHVEAFHRQKKLDGFGKVLSTFRAQRKKGTGKPVSDWRLEQEQMQAIRDRMNATETRPKKKGSTK